jgi:DNA-binding MarR family transcriptional regulator
MKEFDPDHEPTALDLLFRLEGLLRRRHFQHHRGHGPQGAPHQGQGRVLALLKLKPELGQKELSTILDIRPQSLGELLTKLERQGLVTRAASEADRRSQVVRLTDEGRQASEQTPESPSEDFLSCLNADEQVHLAGYLQRLITALEAEVGAEELEGEGRGFGRGFGGHHDHRHHHHEHGGHHEHGRGGRPPHEGL